MVDVGLVVGIYIDLSFDFIWCLYNGGRGWYFGLCDLFDFDLRKLLGCGLVYCSLFRVGYGGWVVFVVKWLVGWVLFGVVKMVLVENVGLVFIVFGDVVWNVLWLEFLCL